MKRINYQLRKGVELVQQGKAFFILSELPLVAVRINAPLYQILFRMRESGSLSCSPLKDDQLVDLLERLVFKGLLTKDEVIESQTCPAISIIIPVKDRPRDIGECLTSLTSLDYPKDKVEIIVVNDGSTDSTPEVIETFDVRAIHLPESRGASACRNLAAGEATGELLGFTDSDCVAHAHWLKELFPCFGDERVGIVGGRVSNFYNRSALDRYEATKSSLNMGPRPFRIEETQSSTAYVPSCNLIIRKKAFLEAGGFQEDLHVGEDVDLCWRTGKLGYHLLYLPQGEVRHKHRNDLLQMLRRRFDYGTSEAILYLRHRNKRKKLYLPPFYSIFYAFICLGIITHSLIPFGFGLGILLVDFCRKSLKLRKVGLRLKGLRVFLPVLRAHFSFSYHLSSFLARYYLIFLVPLSFFYPKLWGFLFFLLVFSAAVDFSVKRPKIGVLSFFFFYTLDQFAYQTGVFWGCLKKRNFMPYLPAVLRKSQ